MNKNKISAKYYPKVNKVKIKARSSDFYSTYLKYLFEYLKIPSNATIVFEDTTIVGGIDTLMNTHKSKKEK